MLRVGISNPMDRILRGGGSVQVGASGQITLTPASGQRATLAGGLRLTGSIGAGTGIFRSDAAWEAYGATDVIVSMLQGANPGGTTYECGFAFGAYDDGGTIRKTSSVSSKWASPVVGTANGVLRFNATKAGGGTDDIALRIFGGAGIDVFGTSDTSGPGVSIFRVQGEASILFDGTLLSGNANYNTRILSASGAKGLNLGYDAVEQIGTFISQGTNSGMSFWTHNGAWGERGRFDIYGNFVIGTAALATTATAGFLYIPTTAGAPTGIPTALTGRVPIVFDSTNNKIYVYDGGWIATAALI